MKIHMDSGRRRAVGNIIEKTLSDYMLISACGRVVEFVTVNPKDVTCKQCLARMKKKK